MKRRLLPIGRAVRPWWAVLLGVAVLAALIVPGANAWPGKHCDSEEGVFPPDCRVYDRLSAEWWMWSFNCPPPPDNPIFDEDGSAAHVNQEGKVWFLAGTFASYGEAVEVERTCTVPAGKFLYIPLVNNMSFPTEPWEDEELIRQIIIDSLDAVMSLHCTIDGEPVAEDLFEYRAISGTFKMLSTKGSLLEWFGYAKRKYPTAVAGAYAVLLDPLPPGAYVIEFGGTSAGPDGEEGTDDDWGLFMTYNLTVEEDD